VVWFIPINQQGQEADMNLKSRSMVTHLRGKLTHSGVTDNIVKSLAVSLQKVEVAGAKNIRIDCRKIHSADTSGLQLLYVWMQCAKFRGIDSVLVNMPDNLQQSMMSMGFEDCFAR
jgi:anti-anti-sigma regulatory factor